MVPQAVARNVVFALREHGLGEVMAELSDFRGAGVHVSRCPDLVGARFGDLVVGAADFRPIGRTSAAGVVELHPTSETLIEAGDLLVVVAHDTGAATRLGRDALASMSIRSVDRPDFHLTSATQHVLVIGWNGLGRALLTGWATSADEGSTVEVVFDPA